MTGRKGNNKLKKIVSVRQNIMKKLIFLFLIILPRICFAFSLTPNVWTQQTPTVNKSPHPTWVYWNQAWENAAYDSTGHRILYWGGILNPGGVPGGTIYSNSMWAWDLAANTFSLLRRNNWYFSASQSQTLPFPANQTNPTPGDRHPIICYSPVDNKLYITHGLNMGIQGFGGQHPYDTWRMNLSSPYAWEQITASGYPPSSGGEMGTCLIDPVTHNMWYFSHTTRTGTTYKYNLDSGTWSQTASQTRPVSSDGGNNAVWDSKLNRIWLFGDPIGGNHGGNNTWWLNLNTAVWTQITPAVFPPQRVNHGLAYLDKWNLLLLYGGITTEIPSDGTKLNDTWLYSPVMNTWAQLKITGPTGTYDPAKFAYVAYDSYNDAVGLQSGFVGNGQNDAEAFWTLRYQPYNNSFSTVIPEDLTSSKPSQLTWYIDPTHGGWYALLKDFRGNNPAKASRGFPIYSNILAWSKNSTYVGLWTGTSSSTHVSIYRIGFNPLSFTLVRDNPFMPSQSWFTFSQTDDDLMYYFSGTSLMQYRISTNTSSTVKNFSSSKGSFPGYTQINRRLNMASRDDRYWIVPGTPVRGKYGVDDMVVRYDRQTDTFGTTFGQSSMAAVIDSTYGDETDVQISPDGDYMLVLHGAANGGVIQRNASTAALIRSIDPPYSSSPHSDTIKGSDGVQYFVYEEGTHMQVKKANLSTGAITILFNLPNTGGHYSARNMSGDWFIWSRDILAAQETVWRAMDGEIVKVYLDSTVANPHVERYMMHESFMDQPNPTWPSAPIHDGYWLQPHATVSQDGQYVLFGSNWRMVDFQMSAAEGAGEGYPNPYILWLTPQQTASPIPPPPPRYHPSSSPSKPPNPK